MSISRQRDLVTAYDCSLEQQILGQGSNLVCRDEDLWKQVEGLLRDGDAQETHCLGLDTLRVMEESLKAAAETTTASTGKAKARGGLQGLAKAFEVIEQAALNLYLGPWREEYKVVKMYSGMFTHYIKPVLSMAQIEKLFSLLGYQPSSSRHEQLHLQSPRVSRSSLDDLLRLSCAFFLARCECRLLLMALGKHVGDAQWEHECCDLRWPDPQVLCLMCSVFHSGSCREIDICKSYHKIKPLGVCSCGRACSRKPLVLCRYCGEEYCRDCWYRSPLECACGQTFDQSSSV